MKWLLLQNVCMSFVGMLFLLFTVYNSWSGDLSVKDSGKTNATTPKSKDASLTAVNALLLSSKTYTVTVNPVVVGVAGGYVDSDVGNIHIACAAGSCGSQISTPLEKGTTIVLTATLSVGTFVGWDGCVAAGGEAGGGSPVATCTFRNLNENKTVGVDFLSI